MRRERKGGDGKLKEIPACDTEGARYTRMVYGLPLRFVFTASDRLCSIQSFERRRAFIQALESARTMGTGSVPPLSEGGALPWLASTNAKERVAQRPGLTPLVEDLEALHARDPDLLGPPWLGSGRRFRENCRTASEQFLLRFQSNMRGLRAPA